MSVNVKNTLTHHCDIMGRFGKQRPRKGRRYGRLTKITTGAYRHPHMVPETTL